MASGRKSAGTRPILAGRLRRILILVPAALAAAWLVAASGMSAISRNARPDLALRFMPIDARAQAKAAEQRLTPARGRTINDVEVERLARSALRRDPTVVAAWRSLGIVAAMRGRGTQAARLFRLSERMSRRDLPTQLWLIEDNVRRDDIAGALRHYDAALRTSPGSAELLLPILVSASAEPAVASKLVPLLAGGPPWLRNFLTTLNEHVPPGDRVAALLEGLHRSRPITDKDVVGGIVYQLIDRREFGPAWRIYRLLASRSDGSALLRNGEFSGTAPVAPFDWQLEARSELEAQQRPIDSSGAHSALVIHADAGHSGQVARQLLLLSPGAYSLAATAGAVDGSAPASLRWEMVCLDSQATRLARFDVPALTANGRVHRIDFRVPPGCPAQWLLLTAGADGDTPGGADGWVDSATIRPAAPRG